MGRAARRPVALDHLVFFVQYVVHPQRNLDLPVYVIRDD